MNCIQRLFGKSRENRPQPPPKERPPDWNLTISDLMAEMKAGKRTSIGSPEGDWAREYERSLIPGGARFPRKGDVYESLQDQKVSYLTAWAAPFTGGGEAVLLKGDRVWIHSAPRDEKPVGTYALPVEYDMLHERMVPPGERKNSGYRGFYLYFSTVDLNEKFVLIESVGAGKSGQPDGRAS